MIRRPLAVLAALFVSILLPDVGGGAALAAPDVGVKRTVRDNDLPMSDAVRSQLDTLAAALAAKPDDHLARAEYGLLLTRVGEVQKGIAELERAAGAAPGEPRVQLMLARGLWKAERCDEATSAALRAAASPLMARHDAAEAYRVAGTCALETFKSSEAQRYFSKGVELEPRNSALRLSYAILMLNARRNVEGYEHLRQGARGDGEPRVLFRIADLARQLGQHDIERDAWQRIVAKAPEEPDALIGLARVEYRFKNYESAADLLSGALSRKRQDGEAHLLYARTLQHLGRKEEAEREARLAEKLGAGTAASAAIDELEAP